MTSYYKACTKYFPVLLRTTKLAHSTSQYYFVPQCLHKVLPSTTSHYKACLHKKYFPVLLRTTKFAQKYFPVLLRTTTKLAKSTSQYYFVLRSSQKKHFSVLICLTKLSHKHFAILLRTKKLAKTLLRTNLFVLYKLAQSTSQYYFVLQSSQNTSQYYFILQSLHKALPSTTPFYTAFTKYLPVLLHESTSKYYFAHASTTSYTTQLAQKYFQVLLRTRKLAQKYFPVLLRTTKLAQSTSQHYFIPQSLHKLLPSTTSHYKARKTLPSTTSYYKACTKHFPVLLRSTQLLQSTYQYYFVLQSLHKVLPSTTSYYKTCTKYFPVLLRTTKLAKHFPVLLRTTKLAQSTSQYYFALQSSQKSLRNTTSYYKTRQKQFPVLILYYKACTTYFSVLLHTTMLAQSTSQYYFVLQTLQN